MDNLREELTRDLNVAAPTGINSENESRVVTQLLAAGWTKPPAVQQVEPKGCPTPGACSCLSERTMPDFGFVTTSHQGDPDPAKRHSRLTMEWRGEGHMSKCDAAYDYLAALSTQQPPSEAVPDEWILVPREPTDDMLKAAEDANDDYRVINLKATASLGPEYIWKAMIKAAPAVQEHAGEPKPLKMLVDADWLREKVAADPDMDCEVRPAPAAQEQGLLAGGWLPIVLCPTDGEWRLCKLPDGSEIVASFQGQNLGPMVRQWRVLEFGYHTPARLTGEIFGGVKRIAPAYDTAVIKNLPEGVYPIYFRPNDTVHGHPALRTQGGE